MMLGATVPELRAHVAKLLGCNINDEDSWPDDLIDRILGEADRKARRVIEQRVIECIRR